MNGDITLEALRRCQRASKVISPFIIFAVQMSTAGVFWSRNLCLSVIMLLCTKFRVNQTINRPDIGGVNRGQISIFHFITPKRHILARFRVV